MLKGWQKELPWTHCNNDFGTPYCYSKPDFQGCNTTIETFFNFTCMSIEDFCCTFNLGTNYSSHQCFNETSNETIPVENVTIRTSPSEEYFNRYVLGLTEIGVVDTWENYGEARWMVIGALALSWLLIALSLVRGVASYGKLSYFITLFPYVVLTIFLGFISQKDGFSTGIEFFLTPDWEKLAETEVWVAAITQIFYSLGVGIGCQLLLSSYNSFDANCFRKH